MPGVVPDARGALLGQRGLALFASVDRLVAFLRAYGEEGSLEELLASIEIQRLVTPLGTREILLSVDADSSYRMDRIAGLCRLVGGMLFTGSSRHFVQYRDAASPFGYDVGKLLESSADLILYHSSFTQAYDREGTIDLRRLVLQLEPQRVPPADRRLPKRLLVTAETGIGAALIGYLFRWEVDASVSLAEWPSDSAFDDSPTRLHLFELFDCPRRILDLMVSLPGVRVLVPIGARTAVEWGYRHPIALDATGSLFEEGSLTLFPGQGEVRSLSALPPFAPVGSLIRSNVDLHEEPLVAAGVAGGASEAWPLRLRLAPAEHHRGPVVATLIPMNERAWLARLLYTLPLSTLERLRITATAERFFLLDPAGIESVPLGAFHYEFAPRIYIPMGTALVPSVSRAVLDALLADRGSGHAFFPMGGSHPLFVPDEAFVPLSRALLREVGGASVHVGAPEDEEPELPLLRYAEDRRFPLWGIERGGDET